MTTGTAFTPTPFTDSSYVAPYDTSLLNRKPYLSLSEYRNAPTAIDTENLVDTVGDQAAEDAALSGVIDRASSWIDVTCHQVLAATTNTESGLVRRLRGVALLVCTYRPILEVSAVAFGTQPNLLSSLESSANLWVTGKVISVPIGWPISNNPTLQGWPTWAGPNNLFAVWTYINGYPHTSLAAECAIGDTSITVDSPSASMPVLGVYPGTVLSIYDGSQTEEIQVASVGATDDTGTALNLTYGLSYSHTPPTLPDSIMVSGLPPAIQQAAISAVTWLVKTRGDTTITLADQADGPGGMSTEKDGYGQYQVDQREAMRILHEGGFILATKMKR